MTPRQVDELRPDEYTAMLAYVVRAQRAERRAERRARKGR